MAWSDAQRYNRLLREVGRELEISGADEPVWRPEYAAVFGTPERLRQALVTRWRTIVDAQFPDATIDELAAAHPGLARVAGVVTALAALA